MRDRDRTRARATCAPRPSDWLKMLGRVAARSCAELDAHPPPVDADELDRRQGAAALARRPALHVPRLPRVRPRAPTATLLPGRRQRPRHLLRDAPGRQPSASFARCPPAIRAKAREQHAARAHQGERALDRAPPDVPRLRRRQALRRRTATSIGEHRFLGLYTSAAYTGEPDRRPGAAAQGRRRDRPRRVPAREPRPEGSGRRSSRRTRATTCSRSTSTSSSTSRWASCGCRNGGACGCSCTASRTAASCRASCSSRAIATRHTVRERIARPAARRVRRDELRVEHAPVGVGARPPALRAARRPVRSRTTSTSHALEQRGRRGRARVGRRPPRRADRARGEETGLDAAPRVERRVPGVVPGRLRRGRGARRPRRSSSALDAARRRSRSGSTTTREHLDLKLYGLGAQPSLSDVLPRLTNMGVIVDDEHPYDAHARRPRRRAGSSGSGCAPAARPIDPGRAATCFEEAFLAVVDGRRRRRRLQPARAARRASSWREVALLRAYSRYLRQTGTPFSQTYIEDDARRALPTSRAGSSSCSSPASTRRSSTDAAATRPDAVADEIRDRARRGDAASTRTASCARCCTSCSRRCARTGSRQRRRPRRPCVALKLDPARDPRPPAPAADVRDLRVLAARRGRAPARRAASRAAASAGRTAAKTSAPRSSG